MTKKWLTFLVFMAAISVLAAGCLKDELKSFSEVLGDSATADDDADDDATLTDGEYAEAQISVLDDGTLYAESIRQILPHQGRHGQGHMDGDDTADMDDMPPPPDGDDTADTDLPPPIDDDTVGDAQPPDDGHFGHLRNREDRFEGTVEAVADDFTTFIVYGTLVVTPDTEFVNGDEPIDETVVQIADLEAGMWVQVDGIYCLSDGLFYERKIVTEDTEDTAGFMTKLTDLTDTKFSMFGLTIAYDENTDIQIETRGGDQEQHRNRERNRNGQGHDN